MEVGTYLLYNLKVFSPKRVKPLRLPINQGEIAMKALRIALFACLLVLTGVSQNALADDTAKHNDIVRLIKMTRRLEIADQTARTVFQQMA